MTVATKDNYKQSLLNNLPPGQIDRSMDSNFAKLLDAPAAELARIDAEANRLLREADPRYTTSLFEDHESFAGLPDECGFSDLTLGERRDLLIQKLKVQGGQSRAYFKSIADLLGYSIAIEELRPAGFGKFGFGKTQIEDEYGLYKLGPQTPGNNYEYYWRVYVDGPRLTRFSFGRSAFGNTMLKIRRAEDLECIFRRYMPGHTHLTFIYEEN